MGGQGGPGVHLLVSGAAEREGQDARGPDQNSAHALTSLARDYGNLIGRRGCRPS